MCPLNADVTASCSQAGGGATSHQTHCDARVSYCNKGSERLEHQRRAFLLLLFQVALGRLIGTLVRVGIDIMCNLRALQGHHRNTAVKGLFTPKTSVLVVFQPLRRLHEEAVFLDIKVENRIWPK